MEMHRGLLFSMLLVVLVALIRTASSLPPDFFRNGRGGDLLPHKRSSVEDEVISAACNFCGSFSSRFNMECTRNSGSRRRDCVLAYFEQVETVLSKKGWK